MVNCFKCNLSMTSNYYLIGSGKYMCRTCMAARKKGGNK